MILSKSKYMLGLQCPLLLWTVFNEPEKVPEPDEAQQAVFDQGHEVGEWAKQLYPDGVEVPWGDFNATLEQTKELVSARKTIFEASFLFENCYARADILVPVGEEWDLIEVKSSTKVKDEHLEDVAFQRYVLEGNGVRVRRCHLLHINNEYVRHGAINPHELFTMEDITEEASLPRVPERVADMWTVIKGERPTVKIGPHCNDPYTCPLLETCWDLPAHNVTELYRAGKKAFSLLAYETIAAVPAEQLTDKQRIQQASIITGERHVEPAAIKDWLRKLEYPLYHLDFETISTAVPLFDGTRPYQQVPFQFSLHIQKESLCRLGPTCGAERSEAEVPGPRHKPPELEHHEFLWTELSDPRPALIQALKVIGPTGTILAYNMSFERRVLQELAEAFPEEATFLSSLIVRLDDLITPFRNFWIYDAKQHGSCSIKAVLPALTNTSYDGMTINKGDQASREWLRAVKGADDKEEVFEALRKYCKQDTEAMVEVLKEVGGGNSKKRSLSRVIERECVI